MPPTVIACDLRVFDPVPRSSLSRLTPGPILR
jgi:hypothetical protein